MSDTPTALARATGRRNGRLALLLASVLWGVDATLIKYTLGVWPPMTLLFVQLASATLVLWTVTLIRGYRRPGPLARIALAGIMEPGLTQGLITVGLVSTTATNAAALSGMESCFAVVLAAIFLGERLLSRSVVALGAAALGVAGLEGGYTGSNFHVGDLVVLIGVLCAASYVVIGQKAATQTDSLTLTTHQFSAALLCCAPFALIEVTAGGRSLPSHVPPLSWIVAIGVGVVGYAGSFLLYNYAIAWVSAAGASMILNLIPVVGLLTAIMLLHESLGRWQLGGAALIVGSLFLFPQDVPETEPLAGDETVTESESESESESERQDETEPSVTSKIVY
jgi:drug/metabolite transporter (DMT)-like permease